MNRITIWMGMALIFGMLTVTTNAFSAGYATSQVGAGGYDVVSYHQDAKATRGSGWHAALHEGTTYLFVTKENRKRFLKTPEQYLPQFGGYCAYGAAVGKKFYADPRIWRIADGKLYLNLDAEIQKKWLSDLSGNIKKGHKNWAGLKNDSPPDF